MHTWIRSFIALELIASLVCGLVVEPCLAQVSSPGEYSQSGGSEYFVGRELGKPLITVNIINGVIRPGVYHVPTQTTLPQLVAFAGGTLVYADAEDIRLRRVEHDKSLFLRHDLTAMMKSNEPFPAMMDKDVVQFRERPNLDTTLRWVAVLSGLATVALSAVTIHTLTK